MSEIGGVKVYKLEIKILCTLGRVCDLERRRRRRACGRAFPTKGQAHRPRRSGNSLTSQNQNDADQSEGMLSHADPRSCLRAAQSTPRHGAATGSERDFDLALHGIGFVARAERA